MSQFNFRRITEVNVLDASAASDNIVLLDVREVDEFEAGHIPHSVWIPLGDLEQARMRLPINRTIVCVCRSGGRSARATETLQTWGFNASNMVGGMQAWAAAGLPVVRDDGEPGTVI